MRIRDLDVIAEDFVVADLERADPAADALLGLMFENPLAGIFAHVAQFVQLRGEAFLHRPSVTHHERRIIG